MGAAGRRQWYVVSVRLRAVVEVVTVRLLVRCVFATALQLSFGGSLSG